MQRIFELDPNQCTREDIQALIAEFRAKRKLFNTGVMSAGSTKIKAAKPKAVAKLDLGDLGL